VSIRRSNGFGRSIRLGVVILVTLACLGATATAGSAAEPDPGVSAAVVGGQPIGANDHPSLAAILVDWQDPTIPARDRLVCSGTVLNRRWILSAGHCSILVAFGERLVAQVGSRDLGDPQATTVRIDKAVVHRAYINSASGFDVALFHIVNGVTVPRARLAVAADLPLAAAGRLATAVGWGITTKLGIGEEPDFEIRPPVRARAAEIPLRGDEPCAFVYHDFGPHFFVPQSDICAGEEGHNVCYGDSGGPLFAKDPQGQWVEIGITSRGGGCATRLFPAVFTDVRRVHGWINRWIREPCPNRFRLFDDPAPPPGVPPFEGGPLYVC
jgi:secreted trypsin-like serine protease